MALTSESTSREGWLLVLYAVLLVLWLAALVWLSLAAPSFFVPPRLLSWDKLQHACAYAVLTLLAGLFVSELTRTRWLGWGLAAVGSVAFGALLEWAQGTLTQHRYADWHDIVANSTGALLVLLGVWLRRRRSSLLPTAREHGS